MAVDVDDWNGLQFHLDSDSDINLVNDIDENSDGYSNFGSQWTADIAGEYTSVFDGNGYEIRDVILEQATVNNVASQSFIYSVGTSSTSGEVKNLHLEVEINEIFSRTEIFGGLCTAVEESGTVTNTSVKVDISGSGDSNTSYGGGFAGAILNDVSQSYSYGTISVSDFDTVGGFYGTDSTTAITISECFSSVDVRCEDGGGGFSGANFDTDATIKNCYALGNVISPSDCGGFSGGINGDVDFSFASGSVFDGKNSSGFTAVLGQVGSPGSVENSYWDVESTNQAGGVGKVVEGTFSAEGLQTSQMRGTSPLTEMDDFDFTNKWETVSKDDSDANFDGYPILQNIDRQEQIDIQKRRFGYSFSPIFRADSNLSITLNVGSNKKAITASFSNDSDLSVELKRDFSSADLINNLFEAIGSVVFGGGEEVDEIDLVDSDTNILFSGSNSGQEVEIEFLLVESQTGGSNESIKSQRESIKKLPRRDAEENQFNYDGYTGFIAVDSVDLDEESDTSYVRTGTLSGVFLPWPKQFTDLDVGGGEFDVK